MRILITGATGLIGQEIIKLCHQSNIDVNYLTTSKHKIKSEDNYKGFLWNLHSGEIDLACFEDVEVIINLAGATIAKRWTKRYKKEIVDSRVGSAELILQSLKSIKHTVRQVVSASAIGIYPDSFQNYYMEDSVEKEQGFLGDVVEKWEYAAKKFKPLGVEVAIARIGLVLAKEGGALPKIVKPIEYGLGAAFGDGKQWQSWIHIEDLARLFMFVVHEELNGVYNAVAPNAVSNEKLTHLIAEAMDKKLFLPNIPRFVMKLVLGEMHELLFSSQRVSSMKIIKTGFQFRYENIKQAIEDLL